MKAVTAKEMRALDHLAIDRLGIPLLVLMENAGRAVAETVQLIKRRAENFSVCVVCGAGNNAGDGFVAARYLQNAGINVRVLLLSTVRDLKPDALGNYKILKKMKISTGPWHSDEAARILRSVDVVVDAIFGFGLNRPVTGRLKSAIEAVNASGCKIVSVDVPSGLDASSGKHWGACVRAHTTVTFTLPKTGFTRDEGPKASGRVIVADIGIPMKILAGF